MRKFIELKELYYKIKKDIEKQILYFKENGKDKNKILKEFSFCLFTPQSKAINGWKAVECLEKKDLFFDGTIEEVENCLQGVRFKHNKAKYFLEARDLFQELYFILQKKDRRELLVKKVKGYGYKEASHFLRNIGFFDYAILDRHILKNMLAYGYIKEIPKTLTKKHYLYLEQFFFKFASDLRIPPEHLDLLLWYKQTGFVFK